MTYLAIGPITLDSPELGLGPREGVGGRRYDAQWDSIERKVASTPESSLWYEEAIEAKARERRVWERQADALAASKVARAARQETDAIAAASRYLAKVPGGDSGQGRNPQAWAAVLHTVRGFALDEAEAVDLLAAEYSPRCAPPLPRSELRGMVRRAIRASKPPWGGLLIKSA